MRNAGLEETQAGIKIGGRNINNLRYADDTTLMAESEEELKSLLMKVKEENEKVVLKLNILKTKIMASSPITPWEIDGETAMTYYGGKQSFRIMYWVWFQIGKGVRQDYILSSRNMLYNTMPIINNTVVAIVQSLSCVWL